MSEKTAWIVGQGEYSDYCVEAVFTIRERALAYAAHLAHMSSTWGTLTIQSAPMDPTAIARGRLAIEIRIDLDSGEIDWEWAHVYPIDANGRVKVGWNNYRDLGEMRKAHYEPVLRVCVEYKPGRNYAKIAGEYRAKWLASGTCR